MSKNRRNHSPVFKSKVAMEALKERESLSELAEKYTLNAKQISQWKQELQKGSVELFKRKNSKSSKDQEALTNNLYQQIGQLQYELNWLKKKYEQL